MEVKKENRSNSDVFVDMEDLIIKRKGGGSIIDKRPLFSTEGDILYILWKNVIRVYSKQTGDFVREFEAVDHRIAGIIIHPNDSNIIIGCTENGELNYWSQSGTITKKLQLKFTNDKVKIKTFHIIKYKKWKFQESEVYEVLITYLSDCENQIHIVLFDVESGTCTKSLLLLTKSQEYHVDVIGNQGDNLVALLHDANLHILNPAKNLVDTLHKTGKTNRLSTCIAGHPEEQCVATGDKTGRVVVWRNLFQNRPYTMIFHWHTLPVVAITFSISGNYMYTGAGECVLVKWNLSNTKHKSFLPRLPAPIKYISIAPDNLYLAVSTLDNGITIVNPQKKLTSVIQNFAWGVASSTINLFSAGLVVDPRTGALVLNSRTGHIQFYDTHTKNLQYNINITGQNFLTQERDAIIVNTEVTKVALSDDGTWMATIEERKDEASFVEVRLKFWMYDLKQQKYVLNTSIELPHGENRISALRFQSNATFQDGEWFAVTTGKDNKFKLWNLEKSLSVEKETKHWCCYGIADYRNLPVTDATFAMDGSLLAVGFSFILTLWIPETFELKSKLSHSLIYNNPITRIEFGKHEACHLVVVASQKYIIVWNILTRILMWSVSLNVVNLVSDPKSMYMAAFTSDNSLYVFTPESSMYIYKKMCLVESTSSILAAAFVPHLQEKENSSFGQWQLKSQLYFLNSNRELLTLEPESEMDICLKKLSDKIAMPLTVFSNFIADHSSFDKKPSVTELHENLGMSTNSEMINKLLSVAAHTLPPMRLLCTSFILSLMQYQSSKNEIEEYNNDDDIPEDNSDLSDDEVKPAITPRKTENEDTDQLTMKLIDHDWSFVADIFSNQDDIVN